eukprot:TRINITY_DN77764_c0_g1_i1.p1 TRINITY_DN77764_c0_g1~~TRINITY_DN77764_c0_g1_i1.p1  ORF type:complete len:128 (+),score=60.03 TRINITY_DN77764_c0_g1_i1:71-454(+)
MAKISALVILTLVHATLGLKIFNSSAIPIEEHEKLIDNVCKAKKAVLALADCKSDVQKAKDELAAIQAKPGAGTTEKLVDEECKAKKNVLEKEECLPKLQKAEEDLAAAEQRLSAAEHSLLIDVTKC